MRFRDSFALCAVALTGTLSLEAQLVGVPFQVNSTTTMSQTKPAVAFDGLGRPVSVWIDFQIAVAVRGQRYNESFSPVGGEFTVSTSAPAGGYYPAVSA